jgi:N-acetylneuraminate synthase/N,N'-diacetyllegionaminate synthase
MARAAWSRRWSIMLPEAIPVGDQSIGGGAPCFIAAEIGINHNGDLGLAHAMIRAAARAGASAVKFQNYRTTDFIADRNLRYRFTQHGTQMEVAQYDLFKRCELDRAALGQLATWCADAGIIFFATPTSDETLEDLMDVGSPLIKNGSDFLTNLSLITSMARSGLPCVLSTGMATVDEIDDAVRAFRDAGGGDLVLTHCTSAYPTPDDEVNLARIPALAARYGCAIGFSDHTVGTSAAIGAVALGAVFVEKHFTIDKRLPGPDQAFSSDEDELRALVSGIRRFERQRGDAMIGPTASEAVGRLQFRLSCTAATDLPAGHLLGPDDVAFRRPGDGLPPGDLARLLGRRLRRGVVLGERIQLHDVQ